MSLFKSLADKLARKTAELERAALEKKEEIEREAARRAAEKATEVAIAQGKKAARSAVDRASKKLEEVLFGDVEEDAATEEAPPSSRADRKKEREKQRDKAQAEERERKARARREQEQVARAAEAREVAASRIEREVDDELAALKRRLAKK